MNDDTAAARSALPVAALVGTTPFQRILAAAFRVAFRSAARVHVEGLQHAPRSGPVLLVANHTMNADPPLVAAWLQPAFGRPIQFMAKEQLFVPLFLPVLRRFGAILVRAGGSDVEAYRAGLAVLRGGGVLGVFPEGTRSPDGRLAEAHPGAALLALRSGVPVLPVGVSGGQRFMPRGAKVPVFGADLVIRVGEPFTIRRDATLERRDVTAAASDEILGRIAALVDPEQRGRHGGGPA